MKQLLLYGSIFSALFLSSCATGQDSRTLVKQIKSIKVVEAPTARTAIINAHFDTGEKGPYYQNIKLTALPMSSEGSEIVITDTVGLKTDDTDVTIVPSVGGVNVIIDANIQEGDYYCQSYNRGKMTCERGELGVHMSTTGLTVLATYSASDHFASAAARNKIIIYQRLADGTVVVVAEYSTEGKTIYVYIENGNLVVASKP